MEIRTKCYTLGLDETSGAIVSFVSGGVETIASAGRGRPLFALALLSKEGKQTVTTSAELGAPEIRRRSNGAGEEVVLHFADGRIPRLAVTVTVHSAQDDPLSRWRLRVDNRTGQALEWVDFPYVVVPDNLAAGPGGPAIFWPGNEGCLVTDVDLRESSEVRYRPVTYPNAGRCGYYPGACQMQFMAYLAGQRGFYLGAHDPGHTTKEVEYHREHGGIRLILKTFTEAAVGIWETGFDTVLGAVGGTWQDAAEIYRAWTEKANPRLPPKLHENPSLGWLEDSPVVVTYPVRGKGHHAGPQKPNCYFPFINALPSLETLARGFDSRILALLMQWEGTAPWAPPYVWPPLGGEAGLKAFADALHGQGHLLGLYASGTAWTNTANTGDGGYDRSEQFLREGLAAHMCAGPAGELKCLICNCDDLRYGYDMCAASRFAREVTASEASKMAGADVDYIQLFDQNLGGGAYQCYSAEHGHPPGPGAWQPPAMRELIGQVRKSIGRSDRVVHLGCEAAAAESYLDLLPFNDVRFPWNIRFFGRPVPAYAYVYHEYINNFQGNQIDVGIDHAACPYNALQRAAYSFVAGDSLTAVMKDRGEIHWGWCVPWDVPPPDQAALIRLIRNLNAWRRGAGKPFLQYGRMLPPLPVLETVYIPMRLAENRQHDRLDVGDHKSVTIVDRPAGEGRTERVRGACEIRIPELSAVIVERA